MPISFTDPSAGEALASQHIAAGSPSDFVDNFKASWNASRLNDRFVGANAALDEAYEARNQQIFAATGQRLWNPARGELPASMSAMDVTGDPRIPVPAEMAAPYYEEAVRKLGASPLTFKEATENANAAMRDVEKARAEVGARASGLAADTGQFLGSSAAIMSDPPILASMLFGGPAESTLARAMAREALVAGTTEAGIQPEIQTARVQAGLPGGVVQGVENVAMAATGAAAFTGVFRGASVAYGALRRSAQDFKPATPSAGEMDAARYVERYSALQEANPLAETPAGAAEHVDRVSAAQASLYNLDHDNAPPINTDLPSNPVRADVGPPRGYEPPTLEAEALNREFPKVSPAAATAFSLGQRLASDARTSERGLDAFMRARATASELASGGALEDSTLDLARGPKPTPPADDPSLVAWIIQKGGINDADRVLAQANVQPRNRPGLISRTGISSSRMSELAHEAGYFPGALPGEGGRAVDERELATAIRDELDGQKLYARHGATGNPEARATFEANTRTHGDLNRALSDLGIDPRQMSNADVRDAVNSVANAPDPVLPARRDFTTEAIDRAKQTSDELDRYGEFDEQAAQGAVDDLRTRFADRMDEHVWIEINGEPHAVPARAVFDALDAEDRLVREFTNCVNGVPF